MYIAGANLVKTTQHLTYSVNKTLLNAVSLMGAKEPEIFQRTDQKSEARIS